MKTIEQDLKEIQFTGHRAILGQFRLIRFVFRQCPFEYSLKIMWGSLHTFTHTCCHDDSNDSRQARIQDLVQGGATAKRGPEARGPKVPSIKSQNSADLTHCFLLGAHLPVYFLIFTISFHFIFQHRVGPRSRAPPPPSLDTYLTRRTCPGFCSSFAI